MSPRRLARALFALLALVLASCFTRVASAAGRGVIVVALGDGSAAAAEALARAVYRDSSLQPAIDDPTARVLTGDPTPEKAPPKLVELASVRRTISSDSADPSARRLLASVGGDLGAMLVAAV